MLIERVCLALMLALVGDVFLGVFSRYILQATFQWYDEVARLCFIWIVFLGAAVAVKRGMHFRMRLVVDRLGPSAARFADRLVTLATMAFGAVLVAGGYGIYPIAQRQVTDALEISMLWFYAALPVGGALIIFYALQQAWQRTRVPA
ncbi:MAG: TRAP transporter small permease [Burkholderiaceae bacterium]|nr:TRAP transporter small permease [Burkholderiaceae bacterium]MBP7658395.1 TRAP transporter small permease [Burkholderiaceae bacterium]